jgi:UDP-glucose 4-epimerase
MRILITGGSGFIGGNLVRKFSGDHLVFSPSRDEVNLLYSEAVKGFLNRNKFDVIVHCATERSNRGIVENPKLLENNCRMFFNLTRNSRLFGRMFFMSSGAIYGSEGFVPRMKEEYFNSVVPTDDYGFSKYVCSKSLIGMRNVYELRLFGVFGPGEDWRVRFISNAICRAIWGMGILIQQNRKMDYLDMDDLGVIVEGLLAKDLNEKVYNVCTGSSMELVDLAGMVRNIEGLNDQEIRVVNDGLGKEYSGDCSRLLKELPGFRFTEKTESIKKLFDYYWNYKDEIDPRELSFNAKGIN